MASIRLPAGYRRVPVSDDVVPEAAEHLRAVGLAESGRAYASLEDYANFMRNPHIDPAADVALVRDGSGALAAQAVVVNRPPHVDPICFGAVSPEHYNCGLGSALLAWQEARARERVGDAPAGARVTLEAFVDARHDRSTRLLADHGFRIERYFVTMALDFDGPVPAAEFPDGLEVRTWSDDQLAAAAQAKSEAFLDHYGAVEQTPEVREANLRHRLGHPSFDPTLQWHLWEGDELVAINWCDGSHEGDQSVGYVQSLAVRKPWRGRGLARNLLLVAFGEFQRRGKRGAALDVDADSLTGATRLYESVGMAEVHRSASWAKDLRAGVDLARRA